MISITLEVNRKCNFRCTYCYMKEKLDYEMSYETAVRSIDWAIKKYESDRSPDKEIDVDFIGGEPLCSLPLIKETIAYINEKYPDIKFVYSMTTNGALISEDVVSFFIENDFFIKISLDGRKEDNDMNRVWASGKGTFDDVIRKFKYLNRYQIELNRGVQVNSVVTKNNYKNYSFNAYQQNENAEKQLKKDFAKVGIVVFDFVGKGGRGVNKLIDFDCQGLQAPQLVEARNFYAVKNHKISLEVGDIVK